MGRSTFGPQNSTEPHSIGISRYFGHDVCIRWHHIPNPAGQIRSGCGIYRDELPPGYQQPLSDGWEGEHLVMDIRTDETIAGLVRNWAISA